MTPLVVVFLRGAADGLNLMVPVDDSVYQDARPTLALDDTSVLPLDTTFGLHPAAPRLAERFAAGQVAMVPACGFDGQSRSHFAAQALLERAEQSGATGWIGRHLALGAGATPTPLRAVAVGSVGVPTTLRGTGDVLASTDPTTLGLGVLRLMRRGQQVGVVPSAMSPSDTDLRRVWSAAGGDGSVHSESAGRLGAAASSALDVMERLDGSPFPPVDVADFGEGASAGAFASAAAVLDAGLGTEVVMVNLGGWDTHTAQGDGATGAFAGLVGGLDSGIAGLLERFDGSGEPCVMVVTEFGRRVAENASGGTDHGRGSVAILAGAGVRGGVHGTWSGLGELDDGDVPAQNSLSAIQAEVAERVLGSDHVDTVVPSSVGVERLGLFN